VPFLNDFSAAIRHRARKSLRRTVTLYQHPLDGGMSDLLAVNTIIMKPLKNFSCMPQVRQAAWLPIPVVMIVLDRSNYGAVQYDSEPLQLFRQAVTL
jgi:hypothetical protein